MAELKRTHNGLWVDPDDQSTWLYHQWLLGEAFTLHPQQQGQQPINFPILAPTSKEEKISVLQDEIKMLEELLQEEPESKCILLLHSSLELEADGRVFIFIGGV